jgi:hypothetical protein
VLVLFLKIILQGAIQKLLVKGKTSGTQMNISVICTMCEVSVLFITDMEECQGHKTLWSKDHFYHRQLHVASSELDVQNNLHTYPYGVYQKVYLIKEHYIQCNPTLDIK